MGPDKKGNGVKAKQLEALKRLGHTGLELDEYERMFLARGSNVSAHCIFHISEKVANEVIHPDDIKVVFTGTLSSMVGAHLI